MAIVNARKHFFFCCLFVSLLLWYPEFWFFISIDSVWFVCSSIQRLLPIKKSPKCRNWIWFCCWFFRLFFFHLVCLAEDDHPTKQNNVDYRQVYYATKKKLKNLNLNKIFIGKTIFVLLVLFLLFKKKKNRKDYFVENICCHYHHVFFGTELNWITRTKM